MTLAAYEQLAQNSGEATVDIKAQLQPFRERLFHQVAPVLIEEFDDPVAWQ